MTLNILMTSRDVVYLSGDFRLSFLRGGRTDDSNTQKLIPVVRRHWSALIAYAGLAKAPPALNDMGQWILEQVETIPHEGTLSDLEARLIRAEQILRRVSPVQSLIISVVGFAGRRPFRMVLSNHPPNVAMQIAPRFHVTPHCERKPLQPEVWFEGDRDAATLAERGALKKMLVNGAAPLDIRNAMADVNAAAAFRSLRKTISRECVTGYLLPTGEMEIGPHGIPDDREYLPPFVRAHLLASGCVLEAKLDARGKPLPISWRGMTASADPARFMAVLHAFRNIERVGGRGSTTPGMSTYVKLGSNDEPGPVKLSFGLRPPESFPSVAQYHAMLTKHLAADSGRSIATDLAEGCALRDIVVILAAVADPTACRVVAELVPTVKQNSGFVVLTWSRNDLDRISGLLPAARAVLVRTPPQGAVRIACIAAGATSVGGAFFRPKQRTVRRAEAWDFHGPNETCNVPTEAVGSD